MTASPLEAAGLYFAVVFGVGFLLGPVRVLLLQPRVGPRAAELVEAPAMLLAITLAGRWVGCRLLAGRGPTTRLGVGLLATGGVLAAALAVGVGLRGQTAAQVVVDRDPVGGAVYYTLVGTFALMPWLAGWVSRGRRPCR